MGFTTCQKFKMAKEESSTQGDDTFGYGACNVIFMQYYVP